MYVILYCNGVCHGREARSFRGTSSSSSQPYSPAPSSVHIYSLISQLILRLRDLLISPTIPVPPSHTAHLLQQTLVRFWTIPETDQAKTEAGERVRAR